MTGRYVDAAFEQLASAVVVCDGPEHTVTALNAAARRLLRDARIVGRPIGEADLPVAAHDVEPLLDEVYSRGELVTGREWRASIDGAERFFHVVISPLRAADAAVTGVVLTITDTTDEVLDLRATEEQAGLSERRYRDARDVATVLQDALLPDHLPVLPGAQLAAHYLVAGQEQLAGGDWFDAVPLPDGKLALVTGDVVGHGARAAATMGQLRAVLTSLLLDGYGVAEALGRLDLFVAQLPSALATTVCLAVLDPRTGALSYGSCGHPPPLVVPALGEPRYLPLPLGTPLGTPGEPTEGTARLAVGDVLMLYTDGLIEQPGRSLSERLAQLREIAATRVRAAEWHRTGAPGGETSLLDEVCGQILADSVHEGYHDDVLMLAARLRPAAPALELALPATPAILRDLRQSLGLWLTEAGATDREIYNVQLAVGEAVTNSIEHGYGGGPGTVALHAYHDLGGQVCVTVTDDGRWRPPPGEPSGRGRGLIMIRGLMDSVQVERADGPDQPGTSVLMDLRLRRPPVIATRPEHTSGERATLVTSTQRSERPRLTVAGPVDGLTVGRFRSRLADASRGGSLPLIVDLTAVSVLASPGVQALHELHEQMAVEGRQLSVEASDGSPARSVLELTGLAHLLCSGAGEPARYRLAAPRRTDDSSSDNWPALNTERKRMAFLASTADPVLWSLSADRCMSVITRLAAEHLADAAVFVAPSDDQRVVVHGVGPEISRRRLAVDPAEVPGLAEALEGYPIPADAWLDPATLPEWLLPDGFAGPLGPVLVVPLSGHGMPVGALVLLRRAGRIGFTDHESIIRIFAARAGAALSVAEMYTKQARITTTLLRDLRPPTLLPVRGVELAARYHAASHSERIGGDFYDVFPASDPDDETLLVFGDVCGVGLEAAAMAGKIRNTLHALRPLIDDHDRLLSLLNAALLSDDHTRFVTLVLVSVIRAGSGARLRVTRAGHLPPLIVRSDGQVEELATEGSLIGVLPRTSTSTTTVDLDPGESCLLYTDGVSDHLGGALGDEPFGASRLRSALAECAGLPAEAVAEQIMSLAADWGNQRARRDDMAVLAITVPHGSRLSVVDGLTPGRYTA